MTQDPKTVAEVVAAVAAGRIGHKAAIAALHLETIGDLMETMRLNGQIPFAYRRMKPSEELKTILRAACGIDDPAAP